VDRSILHAPPCWLSPLINAFAFLPLRTGALFSLRPTRPSPMNILMHDAKTTAGTIPALVSVILFKRPKPRCCVRLTLVASRPTKLRKYSHKWAFISAWKCRAGHQRTLKPLQMRMLHELTHDYVNSAQAVPTTSARVFSTRSATSR
jgi:hypothetical protein